MRLAVGARDWVHGVSGRLAYNAEGVSSQTLPTPSPRHFPDADVTIATGVQTAPWVAALPPAKGKGVYFIQGDETFVRPDARESWHLGLAILTCAHWLADEVREAGLTARAVIPNAIDPDEFGLDEPIEGRQPRVLALYHRHPVKGPDVLLDALGEIHRLRPDVPADVFCARPPSHPIPSWVRVHIRPPARALRRLYNQASVLLHPSRSEGWPLVPMEAAACGSAVVASRNRGVQEYLQKGASMAAAPVGEGAALGEAALAVLGDDRRRVALATAARQSVAALSWRASTSTLDSALHSIVR